MKYRITVTQIDDLSDVDDQADNPAGVYDVDADTEDGALDLFHQTVPIGCLEDFDIAIAIARLGQAQ
jgi:hypothetical protein